MAHLIQNRTTFFEQGREQFEREIQRLMERSQSLNTPVLTIDESVEFGSEELESLNEVPSLQEGAPVPEPPKP
jgi:hypothetical protein